MRSEARGRLVVVSALSGVTNRLVAAVDSAVARDEAAVASHLAWLRERHDSCLAALTLSESVARAEAARLDDELRNLD